MAPPGSNVNLPNPPKFSTPGQGPTTDDDWRQFYRWLYDVWRALSSVISVSGAVTAFPVNYQGAISALQGQISELQGLIQVALARIPARPVVTPAPYTANAQPAPWVIPATIHGQGSTVVVQCFSGPLVGVSPTGTMAYAGITLDPSGNGSVQIDYAPGTVGSIIIRG